MDTYIDMCRGMYKLPQAGQIARDRLQKYLTKYDYLPAFIMAGLRHHNTRQINLTLVVDDFGVKYVGQEHVKHLKTTM